MTLYSVKIQYLKKELRSSGGNAGYEYIHRNKYVIPKNNARKSFSASLENGRISKRKFDKDCSRYIYPSTLTRIVIHPC